MGAWRFASREPIQRSEMATPSAMKSVLFALSCLQAWADLAKGARRGVEEEVDYICICLSLSLYIYIYTYIHIHIHIHIHIYIYICVCTYIHIGRPGGRRRTAARDVAAPPPLPGGQHGVARQGQMSRPARPLRARRDACLGSTRLSLIEDCDSLVSQIHRYMLRWVPPFAITSLDHSTVVA